MTRTIRRSPAGSRFSRQLGTPPRTRGVDRNAGDDGRAVIEVVFLAVLLLIPIVYLLAFVMRLQSATFAVGQAARDAGRIMDRAPNTAVGTAQALEAAKIALADQHVPADGLRLRFVRPGADCIASDEWPPSPSPGEAYDICVIATITLPGVPTALSGTRNTVSGVYTVHVGESRERGS